MAARGAHRRYATALHDWREKRRTAPHAGNVARGERRWPRPTCAAQTPWPTALWSGVENGSSTTRPPPSPPFCCTQAPGAVSCGARRRPALLLCCCYYYAGEGPIWVQWEGWKSMFYNLAFPSSQSQWIFGDHDHATHPENAIREELKGFHHHAHIPARRSPGPGAPGPGPRPPGPGPRPPVKMFAV